MSARDRDILAAAAAAQLDRADARAAIGLLDLTSLSGVETEAEIDALCERAARSGVAAVCVFADWVPRAEERLAGSNVAIASVANFPHGSDDILAAAEECRALVRSGASEVDLVIPIEAALEGDVSLVGEMVEACKEAIAGRALLKTILETGALEREDRITAAARAAVMAGADMLKTSTGKTPVGATPEAALALLAVAAEAEGRIGVKISGGVRAAEDAARYLAIARAVMGEAWISPRTFRFGASSLLDALEAI